MLLVTLNEALHNRQQRHAQRQLIIAVTGKKSARGCADIATSFTNPQVETAQLKQPEKHVAFACSLC